MNLKDLAINRIVNRSANTARLDELSGYSWLRFFAGLQIDEKEGLKKAFIDYCDRHFGKFPQDVKELLYLSFMRRRRMRYAIQVVILQYGYKLNHDFEFQFTNDEINIQKTIVPWLKLHVTPQNYSAVSYMAFRMAAARGDIDEMNRQWSWTNDEEKTRFFEIEEGILRQAFTCAAANGHLPACQWIWILTSSVPALQSDLLIGNHYFAIHEMVRCGQLEVFQWYWNVVDQALCSLMFRPGISLSIYRAVENGHLEFAQWIFSQATPEHRREIFLQRNYSLFLHAASSGRLNICIWLFDIAGPHYQLKMLCADGYRAFFDAVMHNQVELAEWILTVAGPNITLKMLSHKSYRHFRTAVVHAGLGMCKLLWDFVGHEHQPAMMISVLSFDDLSSSHGFVLRLNAESGDLFVARWFWEIAIHYKEGKYWMPHVFKHAASHGRLQFCQILWEIAPPEMQDSLLQALNLGSTVMMTVEYSAEFREWLSGLPQYQELPSTCVMF